MNQSNIAPDSGFVLNRVGSENSEGQHKVNQF